VLDVATGTYDPGYPLHILEIAQKLGKLERDGKAASRSNQTSLRRKALKTWKEKLVNVRPHLYRFL
jgi:hypothetical protein